MTRMMMIVAAGMLSGCASETACFKGECGDPVVGNWGARLPYDDMYAGSFVISRGADGAPKALVLWRWGSPEWCSEVKLDGDSFFLKRADGLLFRGKVCGDRMFGEVAAEKAPGEWQHVDITLYKRHVTIVLNGITIIDNEPVEGVTGGAIDANEFVPGPLYLQGDHSDADYKNMILRPTI